MRGFPPCIPIRGDEGTGTAVGPHGLVAGLACMMITTTCRTAGKQQCITVAIMSNPSPGGTTAMLRPVRGVWRPGSSAHVPRWDWGLVVNEFTAIAPCLASNPVTSARTWRNLINFSVRFLWVLQSFASNFVSFLAQFDRFVCGFPSGFVVHLRVTSPLF